MRELDWLGSKLPRDTNHKTSIAGVFDSEDSLQDQWKISEAGPLVWRQL